MTTKHIHHKKTATKTKSKHTTRTKPDTPPGYTYVRHVPHCLIHSMSIRSMYTDSNTGELYALPIFDEMGEMIIGGTTWDALANAYITTYYSGDVTWFYELPSSMSVPLPGGLAGHAAYALKIDYSRCNSSEFFNGSIMNTNQAWEEHVSGRSSPYLPIKKTTVSIASSSLDFQTHNPGTTWDLFALYANLEITWTIEYQDPP